MRRAQVWGWRNEYEKGNVHKVRREYNWVWAYHEERSSNNEEMIRGEYSDENRKY